MVTRFVAVSCALGTVACVVTFDDYPVGSLDAGAAGAGTGGLVASGGTWAFGGDAGQGGVAAGGGGPCTPGEKQDLGICDKCGTSRRTCENDGQWGDPICEDQGECNPGTSVSAGCGDPCEERSCSSTCQLSACKLKAGAECLWQKGSNFQCCGADKWQFCNSLTCKWHPCASCPAGSSCLGSC